MVLWPSLLPNELCKESHSEFWKFITSLVNHFDAISKNKCGNTEEKCNDLTDIKDFDEFHE